MKHYRVEMTMKEYGYVDVRARDEEEAIELAEQVSNEGGFVGTNSECEIGEVLFNGVDEIEPDPLQW
jgi:hypothetical protein